MPGVSVSITENFLTTAHSGCHQVFSLIGVLLIARPTFIFGGGTLLLDPHGDSGLPNIEKGTPGQRLIAVGSVVHLY